VRESVTPTERFMTTLEQRSEQVLYAIIAEYIATGEPVGSRTVSKKPDIGLSAASIRNIMSDLTDWGYIAQPHVSAGRIPTDRGYRLYVDRTVQLGPPDAQDQAAIESWILSAGSDLRDLMRKSSSVLAVLSKQAGIVAAAAAVEQTFRNIEFIKIADDRILVVLVSGNGFIQHRVIQDDDALDQETLERFSRMLQDMLKDLDLRQARERIGKELLHERTAVDAALARVLRYGHIILSRDESREIFIEGQSNILDDPEFSQMERLRSLLVTFEEKSNILKILDRIIQAGRVRILIGAEHGLEDIESCSIVAYPILTDQAPVGCIAVIGPKRMNYHRMLRLVEGTAQVLRRVLGNTADQTI
jgi:heat-inducible transcriptional repressor